LAFTDAVIVESSTYWPVVWPVMDVHPLENNRTANTMDKTANLTRIDVDTTNQIVTLNGIGESADQKAKAEQLARQVGGVKNVKNNLQIQKQS
jgi:BON domain